jgi:hypothetical protein
MKNILFIEFWNVSPHIETAFELAKLNLDKGNTIYFIFGGNDTFYHEKLNFKLQDGVNINYLPEVKGAKLLEGKNFNFWNHFPLTKRTSIEEAMLFNINDINDLIALKYEEFEVGKYAYSSLIHRNGTAFIDVNLHWELLEQYIETGIAIYKKAFAFIKYWKINEVYVFNGRFCAPAAVAAAGKKAGIRVFYHERGANKNRYYLEDFIPHDVAKIAEAMNQNWEKAALENLESASKVAKEFFNNMRDRKETGWFSFTKNQILDSLPAIDGARKVVTYFATNDDEYEALLDIFPWKYWKNQFHALDDLIDICSEIKNIQLIIKLHPNLVNKSNIDRERWMSYEKFNVQIITPDSGIDTYALLDISDVVITSGSTVGIEAVFWGKPVILLGPSYYEHLGACMQPHSKHELFKFLSENEYAVDPEKALPFGYHYSTFGHLFQFYEPDNLFYGRFLGCNLLDSSDER